ncbi:MAG: hypothetical protein Tsb0018_07030 [Opitutales bacterium]|tara:strand:- start:6216 stop:7865 length:1650 start_codon:yes stop_codon:yes gene_type:complete
MLPMDQEIFSPTIFENGEHLFEQRVDLNRNLGYAVLEGLATAKQRELLVDRTLEKRRVFSSRKLLAAALIFSQYLRREVSESRVGIVLTPGIGATIANIATIFADKVPVNLNFTAPREATMTSIKKAGVKTVLSAGPFQERFPDFPWPDRTIHIDKVMKSISKGQFLSLMMRCMWASVERLAELYNIPQKGGHREAALLFTSGSSGEPKGVVLTHRNILANIAQIESIGLIPQETRIFGCLPLFHSFGFTVTLWYPMVQGVHLVTVPSPLEFKKNARVIREEDVTLFLGTPTFFRGYFKHADPKDLDSLKYVVAGAEKTPEGFHEKWMERFSSLYLEGYGLTETTPVVSVNLPPFQLGSVMVPRMRKGSVGLLFPGMAARTLHPETKEVNPLNKTGLLQLRGPNVFPGYLDSPELNAEVLKEGWFLTGDLGRLDDDGFLYIEGRLSRFSKIGGEMVPHGTIEQAIVAILGLEEEEGMPCMVTAQSSTTKGEELILLTACDVDMEFLQGELKRCGFPNLWIPRKMKRVPEIPALASGKLDLQACQALAAD